MSAPPTVQVTFKFVSEPSETISIQPSMIADAHVLFSIDDGQDPLGFTYDVSLPSDDGPDLVIAVFVKPIGSKNRTRQLTYTLSLEGE